MRERLHGDRTYFNVNRHINPTDVCVASCRLCAFGKRVRDPKAYTMSLEEVWQRAGEGWSEAVTEFHIVGGLHPELTLDWYCEMLRGLKQRFPQVHLKAFTMVEIGYLARRTKITARETLERLRDAGMDSCPAAAPKSSTSACAASSAITKSTAANGSRPRARRTSWGCAPTAPCSTATSKTTRTAPITWCACASCRMKPAASSPSFRWPFTPTIRRLQHISKTTGFDDIKNIAVARLMLDNIPHIKAYWVMMTPRIAQIALRFGADDIDGTIVEERIYHDAGATTAPGSAPRRTAATDPQGGPRARGARHPVPPRGARRIHLHRTRVGRIPAPENRPPGRPGISTKRPKRAFHPVSKGTVMHYGNANQNQ